MTHHSAACARTFVYYRMHIIELGVCIPWKMKHTVHTYNEPDKSVDAAASVGEASGVRGESDDLSYCDCLAQPSTSLALVYRAEARKLSPVDGLRISCWMAHAGRGMSHRLPGSKLTRSNRTNNHEQGQETHQNQGKLAQENQPILAHSYRPLGPEAGAPLVAPSGWSHSCLKKRMGAGKLSRQQGR